MASTITKINTVTVGAGGAASFSFTSIPQEYQSLLIKLSVRDTNAQIYGAFNWQYNSSGGTAYLYHNLTGNGTAVGAATQTGLDSIYATFASNGANSTANAFNNMDIYIPEYSSSTKIKMSIAEAAYENNATAAGHLLNSGRWASTSPITSIAFFVGGSGASFVQNTTATLYGIKG
jgi:hypothetical protein